MTRYSVQSRNDLETNEEEILREKYILPKSRQQIINDVILKEEK